METVDIRPQPGPQEQFLSSSADIVIYGGGAGGGKSFGLLLEPLRHIDVEGFGGIIFRRTYPMVTAEGGLWDESGKLYPLLGATSNESNHSWTFPGRGSSDGPRLSFRHLQHEKNKYDYQGAQIPFIGFDELTHFTETQFFYLLSRNRSTCGVRPYVRATTNPDPDSWVRRFIAWWIGEDGYAIEERSGVVRFFVREGGKIYWAASPEELEEEFPDAQPKSVTFIRSSIYDNKILMDKDPGYLANLKAQDAVTREQLLGGNWRIRPAAGLYFSRGDIEIIEPSELPAGLKPSRHWDLAGTKPSSENPDPDYTAGSLLAEKEGVAYWIDCRLLRDDPSAVERLVKNTASQDGPEVKVYLEQEPGQSGKSQVDHFARRVLKGYAVEGVRPSGDKVTRASAASSACGRGEIKMVRGSWNEAVLQMLENFPSDSSHDDPIDTLSQFWETRMRGNKVWVC